MRLQTTLAITLFSSLSFGSYQFAPGNETCTADITINGRAGTNNVNGSGTLEVVKTTVGSETKVRLKLLTDTYMKIDEESTFDSSGKLVAYNYNFRFGPQYPRHENLWAMYQLDHGANSASAQVIKSRASVVHENSDIHQAFFASHWADSEFGGDWVSDFVTHEPVNRDHDYGWVNINESIVSPFMLMFYYLGHNPMIGSNDVQVMRVGKRGDKPNVYDSTIESSNNAGEIIYDSTISFMGSNARYSAIASDGDLKDVHLQLGNRLAGRINFRTDLVSCN